MLVIEMSRQISIKDSLYEELSGMRGEGSFSTAIESLMKKAIPAHPAAKQNVQAAQHQTNKGIGDGIEQIHG